MDKTIQFRDITGFYTDEGNGRPLILIHGFCEDGSVWEGFRKNLREDFRIIIPDLPGYRNSSLPKSELSIEWMAELIKAILDEEKISSLAIIGHSMGGYIALALAEKYPGLAERIGLFHSHCFADDEEKKKNRQKAIELIGKKGMRKFIDELYRNLFGETFLKKSKATVHWLKAYAKTYPAVAIIAGLQAMINRPDRRHVLKSYKNPVLFIIGKQDKVVPYMKCLEQCSYPAVSQVHILDGVGHMGMFEEPKKTLEIVKKFANLKVT